MLQSRPTLLALAGLAAAAWSPAAAQPAYVGSDACRECHFPEWSRFRASAHPFTLRSDALERPLPLPAGLAPPDVSYVLGGVRKRALYLDDQGFFITTVEGKAGANQYNLQTGEWSDYHAGEVKPFDCGQCHTTGYSPAGHQDDLPGTAGSWALDGVQCEACHGPASLHVQPPFGDIYVNRESEQCGQCHSNGPLNKVPAANGFIQPNAQYNEMLNSPHYDRWCVECHDPHQKSVLSIRMHCTQCHGHLAMADEQKAFTPLGRRHLDRGVECWDCHMPYAARVAVSSGKWRGDSRSHLFQITLDKDATMFQSNGTLATGKITAGFACLGCHQDVVDQFAGDPAGAEKWARKHAKKIHKH